MYDPDILAARGMDNELFTIWKAIGWDNIDPLLGTRLPPSNHTISMHFAKNQRWYFFLFIWGRIFPHMERTC